MCSSDLRVYEIIDVVTGRRVTEQVWLGVDAKGPLDYLQKNGLTDKRRIYRVQEVRIAT